MTQAIILTIGVLLCMGIGGMWSLGRPVHVRRWMMAGIIVMGSGVLGLVWKNSRQMSPLLSVLEDSSYQSGVVMRTYLSEAFPGARILVLTRPEVEGNPFRDEERSLLLGLKGSVDLNGGDLLQVAVRPSPAAIQQLQAEASILGLQGQDAEDYVLSRTADVGAWYRTEDLIKILEKYQGEIDLLVSTFGLPSDIIYFSASNFTLLAPRVAFNVNPDLIPNVLDREIIEAAVVRSITPSASDDGLKSGVEFPIHLITKDTLDAFLVANTTSF